MTDANAKKTIHERVFQVMREINGVEKTRKNTAQGGYAYAGHEDVTEAIRPLFIQWGILQTVYCDSHGQPLLHDGGHVSFWVTVRWSCADNPREYIEGRIPALQQSQGGGKPTAQQVGQGLSYAIKAFTLKTLMLTGDGERDSDSLGPLKHEAEEFPQEYWNFVSEFDAATTLEQVNSAGASVAQWGRVSEFRGMRDHLAKKTVESRRRVRGDK